MNRYVRDDATYRVLRSWGFNHAHVLWVILKDRTAQEAQADLETMVAYFGMRERRAHNGVIAWMPSDISKYREGLRFLVEVGSEND